MVGIPRAIELYTNIKTGKESYVSDKVGGIIGNYF